MVCSGPAPGHARRNPEPPTERRSTAMRPLRIVLWVGGLVALAAGAGRADAAWNNVFQVCCLGCKSSPPVTANYIAAYPTVTAAFPADPGCCPQPCPQPCPQQVCETRYVQRTYYQPE